MFLFVAVEKSLNWLIFALNQSVNHPLIVDVNLASAAE
jgi:hypothetical protein